MFEDQGILEILAHGGVAVYVLVVFSVITLAVALERAFAMKNFRASVAVSFCSLSSDGLKGLGDSEAQASPLVNVVSAGIKAGIKGKDEVLRAMDIAIRVEAERLKGMTTVLGTIGAISPFVGLFGTVIGIIRAFGDLTSPSAEAMASGALTVSAGISEALVATAAGLFVAIPAVILYNFFSRRRAMLILELEQSASEFVYEISGGRGAE